MRRYETAGLSVGRDLGATTFAELCRTVEQQAKGGRLDGVPELVNRIEKEYRRLQEALASLRSESVL